MIELCVNFRNIDLIMVVTDYDASPGRPAKIYGPPENCYPEELAEVVINDGYLVLDARNTESVKMINRQLLESTRMFKYILETQDDILFNQMLDELESLAELDIYE